MIESAQIAGPGFINFIIYKQFWIKLIKKILEDGERFGFKNIGKGKTVNIEFVSANPTGPLHVGHCRGAVLGDVVSNMLSFNGNKITREYYVNDYGMQIKNFVSSVYCRILEILEKKPFPQDKDLYPGDYIIDIAKKIIKKKTIKNFSNFEKLYKKLSLESLKYSMQLINRNLSLLGVKHDTFVYESKLIDKKMVLMIVKKLKKKKLYL